MRGSGLPSENDRAEGWNGPEIQYQRLAQFVVLAVTPNGRFFRVVFEMRDSEGLKLASRLAFSEMKAEEVVRVLNVKGRSELIEKLGLGRTQA